MSGKVTLTIRSETYHALQALINASEFIQNGKTVTWDDFLDDIVVEYANTLIDRYSKIASESSISVFKTLLLSNIQNWNNEKVK